MRVNVGGPLHRFRVKEPGQETRRIRSTEMVLLPRLKSDRRRRLSNNGSAAFRVWLFYLAVITDSLVIPARSMEAMALATSP